MMLSSIRYLIRRSNIVFGLASVSLALAMGVVLALFVLIMAPTIPSWSSYKLVLVGVLGLAYLGALMVGDLRRSLLVSLVLAIPLNLPFSPLGDVPYHAGGALAGVVLYPYDFPLIGLLILSFLDTLGKRKPIHFSGIDVAAILLILWTTLSIYNSSQIPLSVFEVLRMAKLYLLARVIAGNVNTKRDTRDVLIAILIGLTIQGVIGVLQYATGTDLGLGLYTVGNLRRVSGTVGWPNTYGAYAAAVLSFGLAFWIFGAHSKLQLPIKLASILGVTALVLSFSRGAWISLVAGVGFSLVLAWRTARLRNRVLIRAVWILLTAATLALPFRGTLVLRISELESDAGVLTDRMKLNQVAINMIGSHPVLGIGINTFVNEMGRYDPTGVTAYFPQPVHNIYLLIAAETGIVGLALFLLLILLAFRAGFQATLSEDLFVSGCAAGALSGLVVLMVNNIADAHLRTDVLSGVFWLLIGILVALRGKWFSPHLDTSPWSGSGRFITDPSESGNAAASL